MIKDESEILSTNESHQNWICVRKSQHFGKETTTDIPKVQIPLVKENDSRPSVQGCDTCSSSMVPTGVVYVQTCQHMSPRGTVGEWLSH